MAITALPNYIVNNPTDTSKKYQHGIIFLHGYGSSKEDLAGLFSDFKLFNDSLMLAVDAPLACDIGTGYQWFGLTYLNNKVNIDIRDCCDALLWLKLFIQEISHNYNIPIEKIAIFGFSQGAVMALALSLMAGLPLAGIVAHSGLFYGVDKSLLNPNQLDIDKPFSDILLIHGKQDDVVNFSDAQKTVDFFNQMQIKHQTCFVEDLYHQVNFFTINQAKLFLQKCLI